MAPRDEREGAREGSAVMTSTMWGGGIVRKSTSSPPPLTPPTLPPRMRCQGRGTGEDIALKPHPTLLTDAVFRYVPCSACCSKRTHPPPRRSRPWWLWVLLVFLIFLDSGVQARVRSSGHERPSRPSSRLSPRGRRQHAKEEEDPLSRLSRVFGITRIPANMVHRTPPQYMTDLYRTVADNEGLTRASGPYNANTVRSFPDRDPIHQEHYSYNLSHLTAAATPSPPPSSASASTTTASPVGSGSQGTPVSPEERILGAEFHLFKMRPRPTRDASEPLPPHHLTLKVYQVVDTAKMNSPEGLRLLDSRRISTHAHGWITFKVSKAVNDWLSRPETNHGLLVMAYSDQGQSYNSSSYIRFAQRHQHHDSKQPILVVFTDDAGASHPNFVSPEDQDYQQIKKELAERNRKAEQRRERQRKRAQRSQQRGQKSAHKGKAFSRNPAFRQAISQLNEQARWPAESSSSAPAVGSNRKRSKRAAGNKAGRKRKRQGRRKRMYDIKSYRMRRSRSCTRYKMTVDFDDIGWSGWIISPKGYDAFHCSGDCPFPLGQSQKPTNHATVQSIVHALRVGGKQLGTPCCVPNKLFSISLLYFDDEENVILKRYDDMVAASCGCH